MEQNTFKEGLKVLFLEEQEAIYSYDILQLRNNKCERTIDIYIIKDITLQLNEKNAYRVRETSISNPANSIYYTLYVSTTGNNVRIKYDSLKDLNKLGTTYAFNKVSMQLTGQFMSNTGYTLSELMKLEKKINEEKNKARYNNVYRIEYKSKHKEDKLLNGLHLATVYAWSSILEQKYIECIEDEELLVQIEKGKLIASKNGKKEVVSLKKIQAVYEENKIDYRNWRDVNFGGFTIEALRKIFQEREAEKNRKEGQEIDE